MRVRLGRAVGDLVASSAAIPAFLVAVFPSRLRRQAMLASVALTALLALDALDGTPVGNYMLKAHYTDAAIRQLLDSLEASGDLANTTVVVLGDHTEWAGLDMARMAHFAGLTGQAGDARKMLLDRVPLLVALPAGALRPDLGGARVNKPGGSWM